MKLKDACSLEKSYEQPRQHIQKQRHYFANKSPSSNSYDFSRSHVWIWELDCEESWALKNWCFWTVVLEKTLEVPLDWKEIQPVNLKGNQSWIFNGRTNAKAEAPTLWDSMDCSMPGLPVQLPEFPQTHVHWVGDAIQPSHPLPSPSPSSFNLSQHQGLFQWVGSSLMLCFILGAHVGLE